ncbi:small ribosomal subunit protein uS11m [Notothenia coriiceps]|uniref:Small ribosomal subunit protein uS11m n=1 Tax=Notothenia coriiceps TaxID=8208 RepID=A0A6I9Q1H4_9TELE|nr:PREDICTED: 28S ribosomal protein S11, mitochondrial [Notothenia coriiceps]
MYKLNCILVSSVSTVCRQLAASVNASGSSLCGGTALQRTVCSSAVRLQEAASSTEARKTSSKDFSIFPPMPGYDSSLRWGGKKFEELPIVHVKATYNNTHIQLTESGGQSLVRTSCGTEGFKNIKKSTPVAAQTTGISAATESH